MKSAALLKFVSFMSHYFLKNIKGLALSDLPIDIVALPHAYSLRYEPALPPLTAQTSVIHTLIYSAKSL